MKGIVQILIALVAAIVVAFVWFKFMAPQDEGQNQVVVRETTKIVEREVPTSDIIVAKGYIPIGTVVSEQHFEVQPWPSHLKLPGFIEVQGEGVGIGQIKGMVTRTPFQKGEPIIMTKLSNPADPSFLASGLSRGMRAVTVSVNAISSVAGFIMPGDRVDILITHDVPANLNETGENVNYQSRNVAKQTVAETLLSNIKILAVDQRATSMGQEQPMVPANVTLEVTKEDAQRVLLAAREGRMSFVLRPLDDGDVEVARPTGIADLSRVTPPAYFPVLYDTSSTYTPEMVDIFGEADLTGLSVSQRALVMRNGGKVEPDSAAGLSGNGKPGDSVLVIRGVMKEVVGVNRP